MKLFLLSVALGLIFIAEVRGQNGCEVCVPKEDEYPVCAFADDTEITYANNDTLHCNIICGLKVDYLYDGPCEEDPAVGQKLGGLTCDTCQIPLYSWSEYPVCTLLYGKPQTYSTPRHAYCNGICGSDVQILHDGKC